MTSLRLFIVIGLMTFTISAIAASASALANGGKSGIYHAGKKAPKSSLHPRFTYRPGSAHPFTYGLTYTP